MFKLMVSRNCGMNYFPEASADTVKDLEPAIDELCKTPLRWYIDYKEVDSGRHDQVSDSRPNVSS